MVITGKVDSPSLLSYNGDTLMAEVTSFQLEGEIALAYDANERYGKHVLVDVDGGPGEVPVAGADCGCGERMHLEQYVAQQLGFPNDAEFDAMIKRLDELRNKGLQPADGVPDIVREGVKLRITVEVL
jgi:hypothetical protein